MTQQEIARRLNISYQTVSRCLNGTGPVAPETAERIREFIAVNGYVRNMNARALSGGSIMLIGALIDSRAPQLMFRMLEHVEREASRRGNRLIITESHDDPEILFKSYRGLQQYGVSGTLVFAHEYPEHIETIYDFFSREKNLVFIGDNYLPEMPAIISDRSEAIREAARLLRGSGKRRAGLYYMAGCDQFLSFKSYLATLRKEFPEVKLKEIGDPQTGEELIAATDRLIDGFILPERLDMIFAPNDFYAAALLQRLLLRRICVPDDIAVVSGDNERFCDFTVPPLSSIEEQLPMIGARAVELLFKLLAGEELPENERRIVLNANLINRESIVRESWSRLPGPAWDIMNPDTKGKQP